MDNLIVTSTPVRISLIGGGTDFKEFYLKKNNCGQVISLAIDIKTYCFLKKKQNFLLKKKDSFFSNKILKTKIYKAFKKFCRIKNIYDHFDIILYSDIPSGSGLGSSSSFILSLIKALNKFKKIKLSDRKLIENTNYFEASLMNRNIGMQDAWGCQLPGIKLITFKKKITAKKINNRKLTEFINQNLFLYPIKKFKSNQNILNKITKNIKSKKNVDVLRKMYTLTNKAYKAIKGNDFESLLHIIRESQNLKSKYANGVVNKTIIEAFDYLEKLKLKPLKILGAGGRGFVLFYCKDKKLLNKIEYINFKVIN